MRFADFRNSVSNISWKDSLSGTLQETDSAFERIRFLRPPTPIPMDNETVDMGASGVDACEPEISFSRRIAS